jgi:polyribonucleotide 5'-hydroxyl-kinase
MSTKEDDLPAVQGERHSLATEEELRLEIPFLKQSICTVRLQKGSCELWGLELTLGKPHVLTDGGFKLAIFTWHGCVVDVECENLDLAYTTDETNCNAAYVNTHAQLEALRDAAAANQSEGPRVLICGPTDSGKSSLLKSLAAYACKLGRTPLVVDLDTADNGIAIPGTLAACPLSYEALSVETHATTGVPPGTASPLVLWHSATAVSPALWKAQVSALATKIQERVQGDSLEQASGLLVNTSGAIQEGGLDLLLHAVEALSISVVLVMGHDRLYSMLKSKVGSATGVKLIKLPRSGGVVARESGFLRQHRTRSIKRYFYGGLVEAPNTTKRVAELTPFLLQIPTDQLTIYKFTSLSLTASLLPVAAAQTTEAVQLEEVTIDASFQHHLLAVCHPKAVQSYQQTGQASDLYLAAVAGFCSVERVVDDKIHLLSPCAGSLPSNVLLMGDVTWLE